MKKTVAWATLALGLVSGAAAAQQADGPWMVRVRAVDLRMETSSEAGSGALAGVPANGIDVNSKWIPEVDLSYFLSEAIALELVLTVPQKQTVTVTGIGNVGTFKHLPPSLLVQYRCAECFGGVSPYAGAGLNYTRIMSQSFNVPGLSLEKDSWGPVLQVGLDVALQPRWYLNFDVKKVWIDADVRLNGAKVSKVSLDPWLIGIGVGYRF